MRRNMLLLIGGPGGVLSPDWWTWWFAVSWLVENSERRWHITIRKHVHWWEAGSAGLTKSFFCRQHTFPHNFDVKLGVGGVGGLAFCRFYKIIALQYLVKVSLNYGYVFQSNKTFIISWGSFLIHLMLTRTYLRTKYVRIRVLYLL